MSQYRVDYDKFLATIAYNKIVDLSATSVALLLSAVSEIDSRFKWDRDGQDLSDSEWDLISDIIGTAQGEIMSSFVGMIVPHVMSTISAFKMLPCDGGVYLKDDYPLLYDAIDATYIVSSTQFRVPDMRDRVIVGAGNLYSLDDSGGVNSVALTESELPSHTHGFTQYTFGVDIESVGVPDPTGVGQPRLPEQTDPKGGNQAHENRQPYRAIHYAIIAG